MPIAFLDQTREIPDHRVPGMVTDPLDEILVSALVGVLCGGGGWETIELLNREYLPWLKQFFPTNMEFRRPRPFGKCFSSCSRMPYRNVSRGGFLLCKTWCAASSQSLVKRCAVPRHRRMETAPYMLFQLMPAKRVLSWDSAPRTKSNEITAIPELLDMLAVKGAIVSIDAMGTQKAIAAKIGAKEADYILALKGNQTTLHGDGELFSGDPELTRNCAFHETTDCGHGRIEVRACRTTDTIDWRKKLHPEWKNLRCIAAITSTRTIKKTTKSSAKTRFYISSLPAEPAVILAATRAH